ncbi:MAG: flavodoxin family protein [Geobacter sp.]|nr:flavodoxin family protein [Geobacter sp.]
MKVVAINGSPRMGEGNTALMLEHFLEGMKECGAQVELVYTNKLNIHPCLSDFNCWFKTPGCCYLEDDMHMLLSRLSEADIWVLATPVYVDGVSGPLKNLLDRIIPLVHPFIELRDGHCRHPIREGIKSGQLVLVSTCGLWEMDNFDPLLAHIQGVCRHAARTFAGALLRPHGGALKSGIELGMPIEDVFEAARESGRQLIMDGKISPETLKTVSRELLPLESYMQAINQRFHQILADC